MIGLRSWARPSPGTDFVALDDEEDEAALADMLGQQLASGIRLILLAGETAIMDAHDILPRAVERAGGHVESVGAPVDPGNLLMLAYLNDVPVVGAPGCARSKKINIVDWILPRLLAGDRLTRRDIIELGHGGLLQDVPERGMPREVGAITRRMRSILNPPQLLFPHVDSFSPLNLVDWSFLFSAGIASGITFQKEEVRYGATGFDYRQRHGL